MTLKQKVRFIESRRAKRYSYTEIGTELGNLTIGRPLSRQRVYQILKAAYATKENNAN